MRREHGTVAEDDDGGDVHRRRYFIVHGREWALDILVEEGYRYDSNLFPVTRPLYDCAGGGRDAHWLERPTGRLAEVEHSTLRRAGLNLPAPGEVYSRLFRHALTATAWGDCARRGVPGTLCLHRWGVDPGQPRLAVPLLTRIRHYGGLGRMWSRLEQLLREFRFTAIARDHDFAPFGCAWFGSRAVAGGAGLRRGEELKVTWASSLASEDAVVPNMGPYWAFIGLMVATGVWVFNLGRSWRGGGTHLCKQQRGGGDMWLWCCQQVAGQAATPSPDDRAFACVPRFWKGLPVPVVRIVRGIP